MWYYLWALVLNLICKLVHSEVELKKIIVIFLQKELGWKVRY